MGSEYYYGSCYIEGRGGWGVSIIMVHVIYKGEGDGE